MNTNYKAMTKKEIKAAHRSGKKAPDFYVAPEVSSMIVNGSTLYFYSVTREYTKIMDGNEKVGEISYGKDSTGKYIYILIDPIKNVMLTKAKHKADIITFIIKHYKKDKKEVKKTDVKQQVVNQLEKQVKKPVPKKTMKATNVVGSIEKRFKSVEWV